MVEISVVVPVYGCPEAIIELYNRTKCTLEKMDIPYEIVLVDDHDSMGSWEYIEDICKKDTHVKGIHFAKNFGQMSAISAGVKESDGNWIITMDCDLQDVPENIPKLYEEAKKGYDVVFVRRRHRTDTKWNLFWAKLFHKLFSYFCELDFDFDLATFLIASRRAADKYNESVDIARDFGMYLMWLGYKHSFIEFEQGERHSGKSSYTFVKKVKYAVSTMTTFSNRILYIPVFVGTISAFCASLYFIYILFTYFVMHKNPEGWTTLAAAIFLFGGLILNALGIMGVYLGNVFEMTKRRPKYIIQKSINC